MSNVAPSEMRVDLCPDCDQFVPLIHACVRNVTPIPGGFRDRLMRTTTNYRPYRL